MPESDPGASVITDPFKLTKTIAQGRRDYLRGQQLLAAIRNADDRLQRQGHPPSPESNARQASIEQQLDTIAAQVRQAEALLAARAVAAGGAPLTSTEAGHLLLSIKASDAALALHRAEPEEMTAMLNRLLTSLEGPFETRIGVIAVNMRAYGPGSPAAGVSG
jgi:type IV secretory pathway VirB2 component (pilin)